MWGTLWEPDCLEKRHNPQVGAEQLVNHHCPPQAPPSPPCHPDEPLQKGSSLPRRQGRSLFNPTGPLRPCQALRGEQVETHGQAWQGSSLEQRSWSMADAKQEGNSQRAAGSSEGDLQLLQPDSPSIPWVRLGERTAWQTGSQELRASHWSGSVQTPSAIGDSDQHRSSLVHGLLFFHRLILRPLLRHRRH